MSMDTYKIVRFRRDAEYNVKRRVVKRGLTLEEAQKHCRDEATHGETWFDGYEREN